MGGNSKDPNGKKKQFTETGKHGKISLSPTTERTKTLICSMEKGLGDRPSPLQPLFNP